MKVRVADTIETILLPQRYCRPEERRRRRQERNVGATAREVDIGNQNCCIITSRSEDVRILIKPPFALAPALNIARITTIVQRLNHRR